MAKKPLIEYDLFVYPEWSDDSMKVRTRKGLGEAKKIALARASKKMTQRKNWDICENDREVVE